MIQNPMNQESLQVPAAGVWVNDVLAGQIASRGGVNTFSYVDGYAESGGAVVATTLPFGKVVDVRDGYGDFTDLLDPSTGFDANALAGVQEKASARTLALPVN
ncbi:type II toxin-antitoxin system HipA family toxin [Corynebacterium diphtheriae]|uniref:hypothetical protein n=1 Tax=Corynebacterium diphtheriae TaxID=1717 RepID=UPI0013C8729A|nr:hypothetical protein [Corynebacterium diphtheriae]CAB0620108.1 type II toxin-antitoxin system HipA family toxin [Corynebacterium diphtheriae]CAB0866315.1 type II toxin-antitoxin system HipA family toxin [Corynebacterium diphtheriae]